MTMSSGSSLRGQMVTVKDVDSIPYAGESRSRQLPGVGSLNREHNAGR